MVMKSVKLPPRLEAIWRRFKPFSGLVAFFGILLILMWVSYVPYPDLRYAEENDFPSMQVPAVSWPGGTFRVSTKVSSLLVDGVKITVENGVAKLPENIQVGWHNLEINGENRGRALYVAPHSPDNFFWVWVSDIHTPPFGEEKILDRKRVLDLVGELGPAFVVSGGDQTDFSTEDEYKNYKRIISGLEMPVYNLPGNHETYSDPYLHRYVRELGPTNYSFTFGDYLFVTAAGLHSYRGWGGFDQKQLSWLDRELSKPAENKFLLLHIPPAYYTGREYSWVPWCRKENYFTQILEGHDQLMEILKREKVTTFFGHWHTFDKEFDLNGLKFFHSPSVTQNSKGVFSAIFGITEPYALGFSFRVVMMENGQLKTVCVDQRKLLIVRENLPTGQRIVITNRHNHAIPLNLKVDIGPGDYKISAGTKSFVQPDGTFWVRLEAGPGTTEIVIERST
jgi:hypothetical protein